MATGDVEGYVVFNTSITLTTYLGQLPMDAFVVFELKHWKEWKKKMSLKAWAWVQVSKLLEKLMATQATPRNPTSFPLPLMKKPAVYTAKAIASAKPFNRLAEDVHLHLAVSR